MTKNKQEIFSSKKKQIKKISIDIEKKINI